MREASSLRVSRHLRKHTKAVHCIQFDHTSKMIATGSSDGTSIVWDSHTGEALATFTDHDAPVTAVAWHPANKFIASGGCDGVARIWTHTDGVQRSSLITKGGQITSLIVMSDACFVVCGTAEGRLFFWPTINHPPRLIRRECAITAIAQVGALNEVVVAFGNGEVAVYDIISEACIYTFPKQQDAVHALAVWMPKRDDSQQSFMASYFTKENIEKV